MRLSRDALGAVFDPYMVRGVPPNLLFGETGWHPRHGRDDPAWGLASAYTETSLVISVEGRTLSGASVFIDPNGSIRFARGSWRAHLPNERSPGDAAPS